MTKIMDRIFDLGAVDWPRMSPATLDAWEQDALAHDPACRCHKCTLFFARHLSQADHNDRACAISGEVIMALREILHDCGKR